MSEKPQQENVFEHLRSVWSRGQKQHFIAGTLAFFYWSIPLFFVGMTIDWLMRLPTMGRVVFLAFLVAVSLFKAWRLGWRYLRSFNAARTALAVEHHHGALESVLVSAVQFKESAGADGTSDAMRDLTLSNAQEALEPLSAKEVVSFKCLR